MPTTTSLGHGQANRCKCARIRLNHNGLERGLRAHWTTGVWSRLAKAFPNLRLCSAEKHWLKWCMRAACLGTIATSAMPEQAYPECLASLCMLKTVKKWLAASISWQSCTVMGRYFLICAMYQSAWVLANFPAAWGGACSASTATIKLLYYGLTVNPVFAWKPCLLSCHTTHPNFETHILSWAAAPWRQHPFKAATADPQTSQMCLQHRRPLVSINTVSDVLAVEQGCHWTKADSWLLIGDPKNAHE